MKREITEDDLTREDLLQACEDELRELQSSTDKVKRVVTPFKLGRLLVSKIPMDAIMNAERFLVVSDVGLLAMLLERAFGYEVDPQKITFLCHTREVEEYARTCFGVKTWLVEYGKQLDDFFAGKLNVSDCVDYNSKGEMKKFDVIVGNPPFQPPTENGNLGAKKIWHEFIEKAFDLTTDKGHIVFVTPDNWRTMGGKRAVYKHAQQMMFDNGIRWYMCCQTKECNYFPMVNSSAMTGAWYVQKNPNRKAQTVLEKLCIHVDEKYSSILEKFFSDKGNIIELVNGKQVGDIEESSVGDENHQYRYAHTYAQVKKGKYHWHTKKDYAYDLKKVFTCWSGEFVLGYDPGGCGVGRCMQAYIVKNETEAKRLEAFLRSQIIDVILRALTGFNRESFPAQLFPINFFQRIPEIVFEHDWHDDLWKDSAKQVFGFTDEEIKEIEK